MESEHLPYHETRQTSDGLPSGYTETPILPNSVQGAHISFATLQQHSHQEIHPNRERSQTLLFFDGTGKIVHGDLQQHDIDEPAIFVPTREGPTSLITGGSRLEFLKIETDLNAEDQLELKRSGTRSGYFAGLSECSAYSERIKSTSTVSRTLLPAGVVPRLSIGTVEAWGEDQVQTHEHPVLEQFFFGLPGNDCWVHVDGNRHRFSERMLLHVPWAARHGVTVPKGKHMHYVWIDIFLKSENMRYLVEEHIPLGE